jgi:hypothetical protein
VIIFPLPAPDLLEWPDLAVPGAANARANTRALLQRMYTEFHAAYPTYNDWKNAHRGTNGETNYPREWNDFLEDGATLHHGEIAREDTFNMFKSALRDVPHPVWGTDANVGEFVDGLNRFARNSRARRDDFLQDDPHHPGPRLNGQKMWGA